MVSKDRAVEAVSALAPRERKVPLFLFLDSLPAEELAQWSIKDTHDDEIIYEYIFGKAQGSLPAAAGLVQQQQQVQVLLCLPSPSAMANSSNWADVMCKPSSLLFRCFRPGDGQHVALPVGLYDAELDQLVGLFGQAVEGSSSSANELLADADCKAAFDLCQVMAAHFPGETVRTQRFIDLIKYYIGANIMPHHPVGTNVTDGTILTPVGDPESSSTWAPVFIQEVKNEIGSNGDPYFQGQRYHQLYVVSPELAALVRRCVLPVLFLELLGPHLRVSALASPEGAVVVCEPLTPYLHLFPLLRYQPAHMCRVARVLRALKHGVGRLKRAYACMQLEPPAPPSTSLAAAGASAAAAGWLMPQRDACLQLPYTLRPGSGFTQVQPLLPSGTCYPLYKAVEASSGRHVAVKFARLSAHATAVHRAWAAAGLAPALLEARPLPCGFTMLVMELLAREDGWVMFYGLDPWLKQPLHAVVEEALARAHALDVGNGARGVHADLRQANVMVQLAPPQPPEGSSGAVAGGGAGEVAAWGVTPRVMFVDFDWSGLEGSTRLPPFSCMQLPGYGSGSEVAQWYDVALWRHDIAQIV